MQPHPSLPSPPQPASISSLGPSPSASPPNLALNPTLPPARRLHFLPSKKPPPASSRPCAFSSTQDGSLAT